ncbi:DUF4405 domain-containing protein [Roseovarius sp. A21]|uniref:DUF4405 domain-containing protein n=1 Tax=Roseovarius bejariae TaxID=2576383 RepID=A0A844CYG9_9RHOB|nr:DUF4405 domain-containing protein [Roseovarius bejariae]MRU16146.1 DUF4405 domain-containing protein [Roseovarius bejariae]
MPTLRQFATPVTIGAFLLSAVTGVLMFFHLDAGLNKAAHEWLSWALVAGVLAHLTVNYRAFKGYLKRPLARGVMAGFAIVLVASFLPLAGSSGSPVPVVMDGLAKAPVVKVIALTGQEEPLVLSRLAAAGFDADPQQTIASLSGGDRGAQGEILKAIFAE